MPQAMRKLRRLTWTQRPPERSKKIRSNQWHFNTKKILASGHTSNLCFFSASRTTSNVAPWSRVSVFALAYLHHALGSDFSRTARVLGSLRSYSKSWAKAVLLFQISRIESTLTPCGASMKTKAWKQFHYHHRSARDEAARWYQGNYILSSIPLFTHSSEKGPICILYQIERCQSAGSLPSPWRFDHSVSSCVIQISICRIQVTYHQPVQYQHSLLRQLGHFASNL